MAKSLISTLHINYFYLFSLHTLLPSLTLSNVAAMPALDELLVVALRARSHAPPSRAGGCDVTGH